MATEVGFDCRDRGICEEDEVEVGTGGTRVGGGWIVVDAD